ncbi:MAG: hypothetical protein H9536_14255 [Aphanizomenon flos-aquae Clear-A1]|nr:hypothetical protein [Aphanizomenon flos-aquae Clear-A1]
MQGLQGIHRKIFPIDIYEDNEVVYVNDEFSSLASKLQNDGINDELIKFNHDDMMQHIEIACRTCQQYDLKFFSRYYTDQEERCEIYERYNTTDIMFKSLKTAVNSMLRYYEIYLIKRIIYSDSTQMQQECKNLLQGYYAFISTFMVKPYVFDTSNIHMLNINQTSQELSDLYAATFQSLDMTFKNNLTKKVNAIIKQCALDYGKTKT